LLAEQHGQTGECYILGGHYRTNVDLARLSSEVTGVPVSERLIPLGILRLLATLFEWFERLTGKPQTLTHEGLDTVLGNPNMSHAKAARELGYQPRPLEESLHDTYQWYLKTGQVQPPQSNDT
ncbi:MAG: hypothetical protein AAFX99_37060, partial [Myxococcota bacterium]